MKNIMKHIVMAASTAALLAAGLTAAAQNYAPGEYKVVDGIAFNKSATDNGDGTFTVDLESFVTGKITSETVTVPADVMLLLDLSSSMSSVGGYDRTFTEVTPQAMTKVTKDLTQTTKGWIYTDFDTDNNTEKGRSFLYNGVYYPVFAFRDPAGTPNRGYQMYIWIPVGDTYEMRYIYGEGSGAEVLHETRNPNPPTGTSGTMWSGTLYSGGWHYSDFSTAPTATARNYFYKDGDEYYPVLYKRLQVGDVNTYQAYVPLPSGDKYLMSDGELTASPYGHFEQYNMLYFGDLYRNGGWTSYSITSATGASTGHYYKHTDGNYYGVTKDVRVTVNGVNSYQATVRIHGVTYYLHGSTISTEPYPVPAADVDCTLYFNSLYTVNTSNSYTRAEGLRRAVSSFITSFAAYSREQNLHHRLGLLEYNRPRWYPSTSGTDNINSPNLVEVPMSDGRTTHIIKDFLDVTDVANETTLSNAVVMPTSFEAASYLSYGLSLANAAFARAKANPIDEDGDGTVDAYQRAQIAIIIGDGGATGAYEGTQATALATAKVSVFFVHVTNSDYGFANVRTVMSNAHPEMGTGYYTANTNGHHEYNNTNKKLYSWEYIIPVDDYDEHLVDEIISITDDIGGAELEVEGTVATIDIVSKAFSIPSGEDVTPPQVFVAPLTGQSKDPVETLTGEEFVYYTFGEEIPADDFGGETENIILTVNGKTITVEGFNYSAHWCGKDNKSSTGFHEDGYKLILRFIVVPDPDAVGGPEVKTNEEGSGIWVTDEQGEKKPIVFFNAPTVAVPVNLHIKKTGLKDNDNAVFTIYYADPTSAENVGKDPHEMKYESFTKVVVSNKYNPDGVVKITGLDSKYYYRIKEDAWSWTYTPTPADIYTSDVISNPLEFVNTPKETVKQAEDIKRNEFKEKE